MRPKLPILLALAALAAGCAKPPVGPATPMTLINDGGAFAAAPEATDLGLYYAFDDYNNEAHQLDAVKGLQAALAQAVQPDGPAVYLSADMQQAPDFQTHVTPQQAWGQNFQSVGELSTDHTTGLRNFLAWMEGGHRASTHLAILTHGGASRGLLWDYNGNPSGKPDGHVTLQNVARAIAKGHTGGRLPSLDLDACMMASIEVGAALEGVTEVYSGCEDFGMGDSTPYDRVIADVQAGRARTPEAWGRMMVDEVVNHGRWGDKGTRTWSAIRLDASFDRLMKDVDRLSGSLVAAMRTQPQAVEQAIADTHTFYWMQQYTVEYGDFNQRDIVEFCQTLEARVQDPHVVADARTVAADVPQVLAAFDKHPSETMAHGLAIYLPSHADGMLASYRGTTFGRHTHWADFLGMLPPSASHK